MERTFVMVKPDGVQRGLIGRFSGASSAAGSRWWVSSCCR
jgi:nucleoside diphosphate kinase